MKISLFRRRSAYSVRTWLILLVAACVLPLVLLSAVLFLGNVAAEAEETERQLRDRAHLLAEDVDRELARVIAAAEVLATDEALLHGDFAEFHGRALKVRDLLGTNVLVGDLDGQQLVNVRVPWGSPLPRNPLFDVDVLALTTGQPQVSGLLTGAVSKQPLLVVVPVLLAGEPHYLLSLTISQARLQALFSPERLPSGWLAVILDRDGTVIARSLRPEQTVGGRFPAGRWAAIKDAPQGIHLTSDLEGHEAMQAYSLSQYSGWLVGVSVRQTAVASAMQQSLMSFALGGVLLFLVSIGLAIAVGRRLSQPIRLLADAAGAVAASRPAAPSRTGVAEIDAVSTSLSEAADLIRKRTAALEAARAEAERANLAKSKFLAAASHDLRQPVQSLTLFHSLLTERLAGHAAVPVLNVMGDAMGALRMLLDSLLDVSKLDAGLIVPQPAALPVGPLLLRLGAEYHVQAAARNLRLRVVGTRAVVRSDAVLMERILRNLIENALRYTDRGGVVVGCRRRGGLLRIDVVDTGIGIEPERQGEIFEEFYQIGNQERDRAMGLGVGLAVVRRLARLLGHEVTVCSVPGLGSVFSVTVQPELAIEPPAPSQADVANLNSRGVILVIDDEVMVRTGLQAMLQGWGYQVLTAGSVREALEHVDRGDWPRAILADYRLRGGETGLDAIRAVHTRLSAPVPATIITGDTAPERLVEVSAGGFGLLHKPVAANDLHRTVRDMMRSAP